MGIKFSNLDKVFENFKNILAERKTAITEETIRYIFLLCLNNQDGETNNYVLETPYDDNKNGFFKRCNFSSITNDDFNKFKEMDLFYYSSRLKIAFEFKFDRKSKTTSGTTNKAGYIFNDIRRLQLISDKKIKKIFVYVTGDEMNNYLSCNDKKRPKSDELKNFLTKFYNSDIKDVIDAQCDLKKTKSKTFNECCNSSFNVPNGKNILKIRFILLHKSDFSTFLSTNDNDLKNIHIRIYEILN